MPKRLVANKMRKEAGGSSISGYDFHFFTSFESLRLYEKNFKTRKIVLGKKKCDEFSHLILRKYVGGKRFGSRR